MPDETFRHLLLLGGEERAMNTLRFLKAEQTKAKVTNEQLEYIKMMYQNISYNFGKKIKSLEGKTNISSILKTQYLHEYQKELADEISKINQKIGNNIKNGIKDVAQAVVDNEVDRAVSYGLLGISGKFSNIPTDVVETIVSGQLYQSDWTLSKAIWGMNEKVHKDCQNIVAMGIAANKSVYDVAKALERYVDPSAKKDYKWSRDYPGSNKVVDYNASRLARTMMSHAYQESFERATEHDPFIQGYKWNTGHNTRVCPYCMAMSTEDKFGLGPGIYPKDNVPLDHPNGQCFLTIVQNKSSKQVSDDIANWYNGTGDAEMNAKIDKFAESLGYKPTTNKILNAKSAVSKATKNNIIQDNKVIDGKDISKSWERRKDEFEFEIEDVINAQGFDGIPKIVNEEEFDKCVKESNFIAQRTYSGLTQEVLDEYRKELYEGKWYVDCSTGGAQYGQGMYCAADYNGKLTDGIKSEMEHYIELNKKKSKMLADVGAKMAKMDIDEYMKKYGIGNSYVETLTLDKSAKIIKYNDLIEMKAKDSVVKEVDVSDAKSKIVANAIKESNLSDEELSFVFYKYQKEMVSSDVFSSEEMNNILAKKDEMDKLDMDIRMKKYKDALGKLDLSNVDDEVEKMKKQNEKSKKYSEYVKNMDPGSYAALKGYDAINAEGHGESGSYTVILNRTKVILRKGQ